MDEPITRPPRRRRRLAPGALLPAVLTVVLTAALAGCGGGGGTTDAVASLDDGDGVTQDAGDDSGDGDDEVTEEERQQAMLDFAKCMREHGVDMPDPQFDGEGRGAVIMGGGVGADGDLPSEETMQAAQDACESIMEDVIGDGPMQLDPEQEAEMQQRALDFAKCMREHGIDMPDPQFGEGGRVTQSLSIDPEDPDFQAAQEACGGEDGPFTIGGAAAPGSGPASGGDE